MEHADKARSDPLYVFIHIPKTAGTTVRNLIRTNEPGNRNRKAGANTFQGGGGVSTKTLEKLRDEPESLKLDSVRVMHGHQPLGIREYLEPAFPDLDFRYFAFLREPVDRALSHYFNLRDHPDLGDDDDAEDEVVAVPENITSLEGAIEAGVLHDNLQTRMLSGVPEPFGEVNDKMLEQAKRNLRDTVSLVGITERMDESLVLAKQRLGFRDVLTDVGHRVNTSRPRGKDVPAELRSQAERHNRYDAELYRYGLELFDNAPERQRLEFHVELAALSAARAWDGPRPKTPAPDLFAGTESEWRTLVDTQMQLLRLRREASRRVLRSMRLSWQSALATGTLPPDTAPPRGRPKDRARPRPPVPESVGSGADKG